jgi:hypothetical protein
MNIECKFEHYEQRLAARKAIISKLHDGGFRVSDRNNFGKNTLYVVSKHGKEVASFVEYNPKKPEPIEQVATNSWVGTISLHSEPTISVTIQASEHAEYLKALFTEKAQKHSGKVVERHCFI